MASGATASPRGLGVVWGSLLLCPITRDLMVDPVATVDGYSYERSAIVRWFGYGHNTSPMTGLPLPSKTLIPNFALRGAAEHLRDALQCPARRG